MIASVETNRGPGRRPGVMLPGLKAARARADVTLNELGSRSGRNRDTVYQLENLRRGADEKTVHALARALGVAPEELTGGRRG